MPRVVPPWQWQNLAVIAGVADAAAESVATAAAAAAADAAAAAAAVVFCLSPHKCLVCTAQQAGVAQRKGCF